PDNGPRRAERKCALATGNATAPELFAQRLLGTTLSGMSLRATGAGERIAGPLFVVRRAASTAWRCESSAQDGTFWDASFGFQPGRSAQMALPRPKSTSHPLIASSWPSTLRRFFAASGQAWRAGGIPALARERAAPREIEPWANRGNDMGEAEHWPSRTGPSRTRRA